MDNVIAMVDIETALKRRQETKGDSKDTISDEDLLADIAAGISTDSASITNEERTYVESIVTECYNSNSSGI